MYVSPLIKFYDLASEIGVSPFVCSRKFCSGKFAWYVLPIEENYESRGIFEANST